MTLALLLMVTLARGAEPDTPSPRPHPLWLEASVGYVGTDVTRGGLDGRVGLEGRWSWLYLRYAYTWAAQPGTGWDEVWQDVSLRAAEQDATAIRWTSWDHTFALAWRAPLGIRAGAAWRHHVAISARDAEELTDATGIWLNPDQWTQLGPTLGLERSLSQVPLWIAADTAVELPLSSNFDDYGDADLMAWRPRDLVWSSARGWVTAGWKPGHVLVSGEVGAVAYVQSRYLREQYGPRPTEISPLLRFNVGVEL